MKRKNNLLEESRSSGLRRSTAGGARDRRFIPSIHSHEDLQRVSGALVAGPSAGRCIRWSGHVFSSRSDDAAACRCPAGNDRNVQAPNTRQKKKPPHQLFFQLLACRSEEQACRITTKNEWNEAINKSIQRQWSRMSVVPCCPRPVSHLSGVCRHTWGNPCCIKWQERKEESVRGWGREMARSAWEASWNFMQPHWMNCSAPSATSNTFPSGPLTLRRTAGTVGLFIVNIKQAFGTLKMALTPEWQPFPTGSLWPNMEEAVRS